MIKRKGEEVKVTGGKQALPAKTNGQQKFTKKEIVQAYAKTLGTSVDAFINRAIETMERDKLAQEVPGRPQEEKGVAW